MSLALRQVHRLLSDRLDGAGLLSLRAFRSYVFCLARRKAERRSAPL